MNIEFPGGLLKNVELHLLRYNLGDGVRSRWDWLRCVLLQVWILKKSRNEKNSATFSASPPTITLRRTFANWTQINEWRTCPTSSIANGSRTLTMWNAKVVRFFISKFQIHNFQTPRNRRQHVVVGILIHGLRLIHLRTLSIYMRPWIKWARRGQEVCHGWWVCAAGSLDWK